MIGMQDVQIIGETLIQTSECNEFMWQHQTDTKLNCSFTTLSRLIAKLMQL